jgi:ATP-dependent Lhr-like helicase
LRVTRDEAMRGMVDFSRIIAMLERVGDRIETRRLDRLSPLSAPLFLEPGKVPIHGEGREKLADASARALLAAAGIDDGA